MIEYLIMHGWANTLMYSPEDTVAMLIMMAKLVACMCWAFIGHFIADFMIQTDKEAQGKSSSNYWLTIHILRYSTAMVFFIGPVLAIVNGLLHWITDYFTSRWTSKLWREGRRHDFFVVIGLDQLIHGLILILSISAYIGLYLFFNI